MIFSNNGYDNLKSVIIGNDLKLSKRYIDFTFKHFYKSNLGQSVYDYNELPEEYIITEKVLNERLEDLDNLAKTLEDLEIKVYRPKLLDKVVPFKTPSFKSELSPANNVRDITIVIDNYLIETPIIVRNRTFENLSLYDIFKESTDYYKTPWIKAPITILTEDSVDMDDWFIERDFENIPKNFEAAIDGANFLRLNKDIIVNIGNYNQYLGYLWIKNFFPNKIFYPVFICDSHIDGALTALNEKTFLVNPKYEKIWEKLPEKFHPKNGYKYIYPEDTTRKYPKEKATNINIQLASERGMDINVLSINPNTVIVSKDATGTIKALREHGFCVIPIRFRHSEIFAGGIHCSTLDLWRE